MNKIFSILLSIFIILNSSQPAFSYQVIDSIIATVDNDVITQSDLDKKITIVKENFIAQNQEIPAAKEMHDQVLNRLIIDSIQLQMAQKVGISITDDRLLQSLEKLAQRRKMSVDEFRLKLKEEGVNYEELREQIRREMTVQQLQQAKLRNKIQINEQEVANFLASTDGKKTIAARYKINQILLPVDEGAKTEEIDKAEKILLSLKADLHSGKYKINDFVGDNTIAGIKFTGSKMDFMEKDELPSLFANNVEKLKKGEISLPIRSGAGWHLLILTDIIGGEEIVRQTSARHILIKSSEVRNEEKTKEIVDEYYTRLLKGEDFAVLAKEYSEDKASALQGGDLGWSSPGQFVPIFEQTMNSLAIDEISKPFKSEFGWHIMQKLAVREQNVTQENIKNQAYQSIYERKFNDELEAWLVTIREEAFVEIR